ncbi:MAG: hypothetical protein HOP28_09485 [Gemmatimonadales bacterium]|nr:hypothetical protein [Gemmatimonadales bacterium]
MRAELVVHIGMGTLGLLSGFAALAGTKGATLHRKAGMVFVCVMLTTAMTGLLIALVRGVAIGVNAPAALLTAYLVVTALTTVRPGTAQIRWLHVGAMLVALAVGVTTLAFGFEAVSAGGKRNGIPAFPFFLFALVGLLGTAGDLRVMRSGPAKGAVRLARHLWRMCFALFIAALSFFIGQADVIPPALRIRPLLAVPVLVPLVMMFYWLWRVRIRQSLRGLMVAGAPGAAES